MQTLNMFKPIVNDIGKYIYEYFYLYIWFICAYCLLIFSFLLGILIIGIYIMRELPILRKLYQEQIASV